MTRDALLYDSRHEPSEGILERISEHTEAIVALLKARQAASVIAWDKLEDVSVDEYAALVESVKADLWALQNSLDRLERVGAAILPTMRERACSWSAAVKSLLTDPYNFKYAWRRPRHVSNEE